MYILKAGLIKSRKLGAAYEQADLSQVKMRSLLADYQEVYLTFSHFAETTLVTLKVADIASRITALPNDPTLEAWLTQIGTSSLPTVAGSPKVVVGNVLAKDLWQAGYTATLCVPIGHPENDATDADKTDIWVTVDPEQRKDAVDYLELQSNCLATVNGLIHQFDADIHGAYIKNGGTTFMRSNGVTMGLLSFAAIGKIKTHPITADMIYHTDATLGKLSNSVHLKLPFSTDDKVVGIVIAGYLHLVSKEVVVTGPNSVRVRMKHIPYLERYMENRKVIDMTSLERFYMLDGETRDVYNTEGFYSDECIKELLTLSQSFIVEIDTDNLAVSYEKTINTQLPGRFYLDKQPMYPLRTQLGRLPSYVSFEEAGRWVLCIDNNLVHNRVIDTFDHQDRAVVTEQRESDIPVSYHRGDLVMWSKQSLTISV